MSEKQSRVEGKRLTVTRLDETGQPTGEPIEVTGFMEAVEFVEDIDYNEVAGFEGFQKQTAEFTLMEPNPELLALLYGQPWMADPVCRAMGATWQFDYAGEGGSVSERLGRCYELAAKAFFGWPDVARQISEGDLPTPLLLIHGTWSSPETRDAPIAHTWVRLTDGRIWEPITQTLCDPDAFYEFTQAVDAYLYNGVEARRRMLRHQHYGPWHE